MPDSAHCSTCDEWLTRLQASECRLTAPRRVVVEIMVHSTHALEPVEVYDRGRKKTPGLGLVTIYRTLEKLIEVGLVQRVHQESGCNMYLRATQGHQHLLVCEVCGKIVYFSGDDLSPLMARIAADTGYQIRGHWLQLLGVCQECQA
jgi:Fur family ferric uptake transcriptional regulator